MLRCGKAGALPGRTGRRYQYCIAPRNRSALAYAGTLVCFVVATKLTTSAAAIFLQSTAPIWVLVMAPLVAGEEVRRRDLPYVGAAAAGLLLVFLGSGDTTATAPRPGVGNAAALVSGLFYAVLMMSLRRLSRGGRDADRSLPATVLGNALAFALCLPWALPVAAWSGRDVAAVLYLGVIQIGFAYWLFTRALRLLPALGNSEVTAEPPLAGAVRTPG